MQYFVTMDSAPTTLGPAFTSSRVITFADLPEEDREAFMKFFVEQKVSFFHDADGSYVANIRMYDPNVVDLAPRVSNQLRLSAVLVRQVRCVLRVERGAERCIEGGQGGNIGRGRREPRSRRCYPAGRSPRLLGLRAPHVPPVTARVR